MSIKSSLTLGMAKPPRILLDTNIIISALVFGGKPREILNRVQRFELEAIISPQLLSELSEVLVKKFRFSKEKTQLTENLVKKCFKQVYPSQQFNILKDKDDNRVLEAAYEGSCNIIITGDKELLELAYFQDIIITTPEKFLQSEF